jgi:hypothetical protein
MGIVNGSVRFRRYQVTGEPDSGFRDGFEEAIQRQAFSDFTPNDQREEVLGWVAVDDWFDSNLPHDRWLIQNSICLTLRIDTKRIPAKFFKQECRKLETEWKLKAGREDLTRAERDEIQAIVRTRLLERVIPACRGVDVAWHLDLREVLCWNTSDRINETFRTLFERTFRFKLRPLFPFFLAQRLVGEGAGDVLERVVPSSFRPEGGE